ncbi:hypothetical protein EGW08_016054, partial [Elysia chlorotica]
GVPAVLVGVSAALDWQGYGTRSSCWLSIERSTVWVFVGPVVAITLVSLFLSHLIQLCGPQFDQACVVCSRTGAKAGLFLCPLLGLTWISGLAAVSRETVLFQYAFAALNSFQVHSRL